jgi:hypothetical protein
MTPHSYPQKGGLWHLSAAIDDVSCAHACAHNVLHICASCYKCIGVRAAYVKPMHKACANPGQWPHSSTMQSEGSDGPAQKRVKKMPSRMKSILYHLIRIDAPQILLYLVWCMWLKLDIVPGLCQHVETFAGDHEVSNMISRRSEGFAYAIDRRFGGPHMDILEPLGLLHALHMTLQCTDDGGHSTAPVCSSYVWVHAGTSGRSLGTPTGHAHRPYVCNANIMCDRVVLIAYLCSAMGIFFLLEQPMGSGFELMPRFQDVAPSSITNKSMLKQ